MAMGKKYKIECLDGEPIPEDEPFLVLRAHDLLAFPVLVAYAESVFDLYYDADADTIGIAEARFSLQVQRILRDFRDFKESHPGRMKYPD